MAIVGRHIAALPNTVILKTLNVFTNKFPELAIMHVPTFMEELESRPLSREIMALLGAVLAVTSGQLAVLGASWVDMLLTREEYALYTREMLSQFILQPPKLQVVQILLIITLYEWGTRNFHKAWMYCGKFFKNRYIRQAELPIHGLTALFYDFMKGNRTHAASN